MERQMDGQAKHNRAPPTRWREPKYILGHTDVLINDTHVFASSPAKVSSYLPFDKPFASRPSKFIISAD